MLSMRNLRELRESVQREVLCVAAALQQIEDPESVTDQEIWDMMTDLQDAVGELEEWYENLVGLDNNRSRLTAEDDLEEEI